MGGVYDVHVYINKENAPRKDGCVVRLNKGTHKIEDVPNERIYIYCICICIHLFTTPINQNKKSGKKCLYAIKNAALQMSL